MKLTLFILAILSGFASRSQKIDSICFHLYTDSLKKGTNNYINVDAKMSDGSWKPLTAKQIQFSSSACTFSGNELIIPFDFKEEKITITAVLKTDPSHRLETTMWIKRKPDPDTLPSVNEIMKKGKRH